MNEEHSFNLQTCNQYNFNNNVALYVISNKIFRDFYSKKLADCLTGNIDYTSQKDLLEEAKQETIQAISLEAALREVDGHKVDNTLLTDYLGSTQFNKDMLSTEQEINKKFEENKKIEEQPDSASIQPVFIKGLITKDSSYRVDNYYYHNNAKLRAQGERFYHLDKRDKEFYESLTNINTNKTQEYIKNEEHAMICYEFEVQRQNKILEIDLEKLQQKDIKNENDELKILQLKALLTIGETEAEHIKNINTQIQRSSNSLKIKEVVQALDYNLPENRLPISMIINYRQSLEEKKQIMLKPDSEYTMYNHKPLDWKDHLPIILKNLEVQQTSLKVIIEQKQKQEQKQIVAAKIENINTQKRIAQKLQNAEIQELSNESEQLAQKEKAQQLIKKEAEELRERKLQEQKAREIKETQIKQQKEEARIEQVNKQASIMAQIAVYGSEEKYEEAMAKKEKEKENKLGNILQQIPGALQAYAAHPQQKQLKELKQKQELKREEINQKEKENLTPGNKLDKSQQPLFTQQNPALENHVLRHRVQTANVRSNYQLQNKTTNLTFKQ